MTKHSQQMDKYVGNLGDGSLYAFQLHAFILNHSCSYHETIRNAYYIEFTIYRFTPQSVCKTELLLCDIPKVRESKWRRMVGDLVDNTNYCKSALTDIEFIVCQDFQKCCEIDHMYAHFKAEITN